MAFRFDGTVNTALGNGLSGVYVYVCTQPADTDSIPPSPLASLFTDSGAGTPLANPVITDGLGNYFFYAATGLYTLVIYDPLQRIETQIFPDQAVLSPGGGSVTSVALTMPAEWSITGSPITSAGTLAVSKVVQNANAVYAGPTTGAAAAPTFRPLVAADLPSSVGTVKSVAETITAGALFSASITGSPITSTGTLGILLDFAPQLANLVIAGPSSGGGTGAVTARTLVPADLPGSLTVAAAPSISFDASASDSFFVTLNQNVSLSAITNGTKGQRITICITQNATGNWTFTFPATVLGSSVIGPDANSVSLQDFLCVGSNTWRATGPGRIMPA